MSKLARIHPLNPATGHTLRRYSVSGSNYPIFEIDKGWYEVSNAMADRLKKILTNPRNPYSPPVFQIMTHEQAAALDEVEGDRVATATAPVPRPRRENVMPDLRDHKPEEDASRPAFLETADAFLSEIDDFLGEDDDDTDEEEEAVEPEAKKVVRKKTAKKKTRKTPAKRTRRKSKASSK